MGPYGEKTNQEKIELGDIAQLSFDGSQFGHTLVITIVLNCCEAAMARVNNKEINILKI